MRAAAQLSTLLICAALASATRAQELEIRGRIVDADDNPVSGVALRLVPILSPYEQLALEISGLTDPESVQRATSDDNGSYGLMAPEPGFWLLIAEAPGSVPMEYAFRREPLLESVALPPLELEPGRKIKVEVVLPGGEPAESAWVETWASEERRVGRWHSAWRRSLPPVLCRGNSAEVVVPRASNVELQAWTQSYLPSPKIKPRGGRARLQLRPSVQRQLRLTDVDGSPLTDALYRSGEVQWPGDRTDDRGLVAVEGDRQGAQTRVLLPDGRALSLRLADDEGLAGEPFEVVVADSRLLGGQVLDSESRRPIAGAFVYPAGAVGRWVRSDNRGGFSLALEADEPAGISAAAAGYLIGRAQASADAAALTLALEPAVDLPGRVLDASGNPIAGVEVLASPFSIKGGRYRMLFRTPTRRAVSDTSGAFLLPRLKRDLSWAIVARTAGFAPAEERLRDVVASAGAGGPTLIFERGTLLTGRIVAPDGRGVTGATLRLERTESDQRMRFVRRSRSQTDPFRFDLASGADGEFAHADAPAGSFNLSIEAPGFARLDAPVIEIEQGARDHDLGLITLEAGIEVYGRIVDSDGLPLAGAEVTVSERFETASSSAGHSTDIRSTSDAGGEFTLVDRKRGELIDLRVSHEGYVDRQVDRVRVPPDEPLEVRLEAAVTVAGRVIGPEGQPILGANVSVARDGGGSSWGGHVYSHSDAFGMTDDLGRFLIQGVEPGTVRISAEANGWLSSQIGGIELVVGSELEDIELELNPGATVSGRVIGPGGQPVADAMIGIREAATMRFGGTPSDGDGNYTLGGVEPGQRVLVAHHEGLESIQELEVTAGSNRLDFYFEAGVEISGTVTSPSGVPVEGAEVSLSSPGSRSFRSQLSAETDAAGGFRIDNVKDGLFRVTANHSAFGAVSLDEPVEVRGASVVGLQLRLATGVTVTGSILGATAEELPNLEVTAVQQQAGLRKEGRVDSDGGYRIESLSPGSWQIWAQSTTGRQKAMHLDIDEGETEVLVDIEFEQGLELSGRVVNDDEPLSGAWVFLAGTDTDHSASTQLDHLGRFRFQGLQAGTYSLSISDFETGLSHSETVELLRDDDIVVEVGSGVVTGLITDQATRAPLQGVSIILEVTADSGEAWRGAPQGAVSDNSGRFRLSGVTQGIYRLQAQKAGYATQRLRLEVSATGLDDVDLALERVEGLSFILLNSGGSPVSQVTYALRDLGGRVVQSGRESATSEGRVRLASAPDGEWSLLLQSTGSAVQAVRTQAPRDDLVVHLRRAAILEIRVDELQHDSSTIARMHLTSAEGLRHEALDWRGGVTDDWRLHTGQLTLDHLLPGRWIVSINTADGRSWERSVRLEAGTNDPVVFN